MDFLTDPKIWVVAAFEFEIPKGYIYFAMAFSVVEMLDIRYRESGPVDLHGISLADAEEAPAEYLLGRLRKREYSRIHMC